MGMQLPWLPISLSDDRTVRSAMSLLIPVTSYLLARRLDDEGDKRVVAAFVVVACLSVLLGLAQLLGGENSPLRPYDITNRSAPVGLFANTNHLATFLLATIPLAIAVTGDVAARSTKSVRDKFGQYAGYGAAAICILGLLLVGSNAGLILLVPALAGALLLGPGRKLMEKRYFSLIFSLGLAACVGSIILGLTSGFLTDKVGVSATSRTQITGVTLESARKYLPVGSGLGSFPAIYLMDSGGEGSSNEWTNHAHDDLAEIALELGLPGLLLMAAFALWMSSATLALWNKSRGTGRANALARAASIGAVLIALHSLVDYPLRTAAIASLFGFALAKLAGRNGEGNRAPAP